MEKLLFIDSSFHKRTNSSGFLCELLGKHFDVEKFFIEDEQPEAIRRKGRESFSAVVFLQISPAYYINWFRGQNIIFIPMYDTFTLTRRRHLLFLKNVKWICFTEKYKPFLSNVDSLFVKYYPELRLPSTDAKADTFFFWQRRDEINWSTVRALLGDAKVEAVNIHEACDPGMTFVEPAADDRRKFKVSITSWFRSRNELEEYMSRYAYYFAPRGKEGIGLSFLGAMAMGMVVIAPNDATMNEYIEHGVNGYLFDMDDPKPISFGDYSRIRDRSISDASQGREAWLRSESEIVDFIRKKPRRISYFVNKGQLVDAWIALRGMRRGLGRLTGRA